MDRVYHVAAILLLSFCMVVNGAGEEQKLDTRSASILALRKQCQEKEATQVECYEKLVKAYEAELQALVTEGSRCTASRPISFKVRVPGCETANQRFKQRVREDSWHLEAEETVSDRAMQYTIAEPRPMPEYHWTWAQGTHITIPAGGIDQLANS